MSLKTNHKLHASETRASEYADNGMILNKKGIDFLFRININVFLQSQFWGKVLYIHGLVVQFG